MNNYRKYKAVIIGCGKIGAEEWRYQESVRPATHAAAYWNHPKIQLAGFCDVDLKKLKKVVKFFPGVPIYSSAKKMLEEIKPDIVSVATHSDTHFKFVNMAANFGVKAIICEKPVSNSLKGAEAMVRICKLRRCLLFVGHLRHFDPLISKWQEKVNNGVLGKILQVRCIYHNGALNNGTHTVDLLRWFLGGASKVSGFYNFKTSNPRKDKNIDAVIYFKNNTKVVLQSVSQRRRLTEWVFYGEKGELAIKKLGMEISYKNLKIGKPRSLMAPMVSHVVSCLEGKEKMVSTGQDGLAVLKILFSIIKSAENNGKIMTIT